MIQILTTKTKEENLRQLELLEQQGGDKKAIERVRKAVEGR